MGERVAAKGVTVVDDGTIADRRGSLTIDDEGTPTNRTVLIEDGILVGYMQDRQNARLMGVRADRQWSPASLCPYADAAHDQHLHAGRRRDPGEILASVKNGIYAVSFGGGQVDITSGKFVFLHRGLPRRERQGRRADQGRHADRQRPETSTRVEMIGNDMELDPGIGTCGKHGQGVPVGVGQPTLRMDRITVGGTG